MFDTSIDGRFISYYTACPNNYAHSLRVMFYMLWLGNCFRVTFWKLENHTIKNLTNMEK